MLALAPMLAFGQPPPSLAELVRQFEQPEHFWIQIEVAKKIVAFHAPSILPKLEPWLRHDDRHLRANAGFLFAALGDRRGFDVVVAILNDRSDRCPGQGGIAPTRRSVSGDEDSACGKIPRSWSLQLQIASDRYYAAHVLGDLRDPRAVPILVPLLHEPVVDHIVPWSLSQIGDRAAIRPLIDMLADADPDMRVLSIYALETLRATEALPALRALLADLERIRFDRQISVAEAAAEAIAKIEGPSR
jgi:HEAT repeat protein